MGTRTIVECDRCRHEIRNNKISKLQIIKVAGLVMCEPCGNKLKRFMQGEDHLSTCCPDPDP